METLFSAEGRVGRLVYFLVGLVACLPMQMADNIWKQGQRHGYISDAGWLVLFSIFALCAYIGICNTIKRLHDLNRTGWDYFLLFIPLYNIYLFFLLFLARGSQGPNDFGPDPLQAEDPFRQKVGRGSKLAKIRPARAAGRVMAAPSLPWQGIPS